MPVLHWFAHRVPHFAGPSALARRYYSFAQKVLWGLARGRICSTADCWLERCGVLCSHIKIAKAATAHPVLPQNRSHPTETDLDDSGRKPPLYRC